MTEPDQRLWGVVPAAGKGRRFGTELPKQYLSLSSGVSVLDCSINALFADERVAGVMVAIAADDRHWPAQSSASRSGVLRCEGGEDRAVSVRNALAALLAGPAAPHDWVLVHDAARPGLPAKALSALIRHCLGSGQGAVLAVPVRDTLKRCDAGGQVLTTLSREGLWQAQTPQMFPLGALFQALDTALQSAQSSGGEPPTDEAVTMEAAGYPVGVVKGSWRNFKLTLAEDMELLEAMDSLP